MTVCESLLENDIDIEHACEMSCACTTCHVLVREGFNSLNEAAAKRKKTCWTWPGAWKPIRACHARPWWTRKTWWSKYRNTPSTTPAKTTEQGANHEVDRHHAIAEALYEKHPEVDPLTVRFTDLHNWVVELEASTTTTRAAVRSILEAVQQAWIDEAE
jgi:FeS assembly protein IscX